MADLDRDELVAIVEDVSASQGGAGFGLAVHQGGQLIEASAGVANPELGIAMTDDTLIQIGSTAKLYNAILVMRLVETGVLDLDRPVVEFVESLRLADAEATKTITLRHLLSMTSGMDGGSFDDHGSDKGCLARFVDTLGELRHLFPPGAGFSYSNAGVVLAGFAAECATGRRWDDLLREEILIPAGLERTETLMDGLVFHRVAVGVDPDGDVLRPWTMTRSLGPAGSGAAASAGDLASFGALFLSEGRSAYGSSVVSAETIALMTEPVVDVATGFPAEKWCLGPGRTDTGTHLVYGHPGFNMSGGSVLWWVPELGISVGCATNAPASYAGVLECARQVISRSGGRPPGDPVADPTQPIDHMREFTGVYDSQFLRYEVKIEDGQLLLDALGQDILVGHEVSTRLVPAGRHGFLPEEPLLPGFDAPMAVGFADYAGVRILLNGNTAAPKAPDAAS